MTRRALLIGSQTGGLTGVHSDVDLMRTTLEGLDFETTTAIESDATRQGILAAYRDLAQATGPDDAVLVYYSGHGGRIPNPIAPDDPDAPRYLQFIIPRDFDDAPEDEFRGVLAEELSLLQAELTTRTRNVTTVLDCCHSARMSRNPSRLPRAREARGLSTDAIRAAYQAARQAPGADRIAADSNPLAIRVVACAPDQSAYELTLPDGSRHGALTARFCTLLSDRNWSRLTWHQLLGALRPAVMDLVELQRPEIEGPTDRRVFTTEERSATAVLPVVVEGGTPHLVAPSMFGVAEGDRYALVAAGGDLDAPLAVAVVDRVQAGRARLAIQSGALDGRAGVEGHPLSVAIGRRPVCVSPAGAPGADRVIEVLRGSPHTRVVGPDAPGLLATVELRDGGMRLLDAGGEPLHDGVRSLDESALQSLTRDVLQLARAAHLRDLPSGEGSAALPDDVTVEYVRLTDGGEIPLEASGEHLFDGDRVVVRLHNTGSEQRYASVFDIGLRGSITLLSTSEPSGLTLAPGDVHELYRGPAGLTGMELYWPEDLPGPAARPESLVTVITDRRQDLTRLHQPGVSRAKTRRPASPLEQLADSVATGVRDARPPRPDQDPVRYRVARYDFLLHPEKRVRDDEPAFELDERPDLSFRLVIPRTGTAPRHVAVRLREVVVHSNRAILGSTVRIDSMVLTQLDGQSGAPYQAATARFDRVRDGDRLPLDNFLVYEGPVSGFLDLAVWLARDDKRELDLAELLQQETNRQDVQTALATLAGLAVAAPQAAVAVASVAAVAVLVRTGAALLDAAVGKSIGVYRTSLLPHERFGAGDPVGRHPRAGLLRAQDMSFAFEVVES